MKYYIIAGEASGDLHGSNLMKGLKKSDARATFRIWGGDLMQEQGGELVKHYRDLAFMGFLEVLLNIRTIAANIRLCKKDMLEYKPDALILIDYPGFNLRMAEFAARNGIRVFYYISPQIWAWKKSRVHKIGKYVERMFVILPFEKDFYASFGYEVDFAGHPLLDVVKDFPRVEDSEFRRYHSLDNRPLVALLPGSRRQEIKTMLPVMLKVCRFFPDYRFVVAGAPSVEIDEYRKLGAGDDVKVISGSTHELLAHSFAALVTSGTATLETALFNVPEVVCYRGSYISYQIAKRVVDKKFIRFISLVNLIMGREVVKELIQSAFNPSALKTELSRILNDDDHRNRIMKDYRELVEKLGGQGASIKTAAKIVDLLTSETM
ncbi:MAG: lipid-A-disaccharide synthase [Bacteroidales bacterium]|nr:lipid-A-disaccharide synthase [Bacteroidales bacterium]